MRSKFRHMTDFITDRLFAPFLGMGIAAGALLLILGFTFYHSMARQEALVDEMAVQKGNALVTTLEASLHAGMRMGWPQQTLETLLGELSRQKDVAFLSLLTKEGTVVARSDREGKGKMNADLHQLALSSTTSDELVRIPESGDVIFFARRLRPRLVRSGGAMNPEMMGHSMGAQSSEGKALMNASELIAVVGIRAAEFAELRSQARHQTFIIALIIVLLTSGSVYVGFVIQGYQMANSNLRRLEQITGILNKFVPTAVRKLLEGEAGPSLEKVEQDVTVMFLDIAGYTVLSEKMEREELNALVERYFSKFLERVHRHRGDVTETAGDGLMVLFRDGNLSDHPFSAGRAALEIRKAAYELNEQNPPGSPSLKVNIGINTGPCLVGSTKIQAESGERWTYTATGSTTNVAARLCALASEGQILIGPESAARLENKISLELLGERKVKNVTEPISVFFLPDKEYIFLRHSPKHVE